MQNTRKTNPFTPTFGQTPLCMAGRQPILREMTAAFNSDARMPELTMLLSGARGTGKTALLARLRAEAEERGWISIATVCAPQMLQDILVQTHAKATHLIDTKPSRLTGIGIGQLINAEWEQGEQPPSNWRLQLQQIVEQLNEQNIGVLITVDEVDPSEEEMIQLASTYQIFVTEQRKVALVMAGLPYNIEKAKGDKNISFIRRAQQRHLGAIADAEVEDAMRKTIQAGGRDVAPEALQQMVKDSNGFPFMIQLIGYRTWDVSPSEDVISHEDALQGIKLANSELETYVLDSTYRELSNMDVEFLKALIAVDKPANITEIAQHMGKPNSYASTYRERLLRRGIIGEPDRNKIDFELPGFKEFLKKRLG